MNEAQPHLADQPSTIRAFPTILNLVSFEGALKRYPQILILLIASDESDRHVRIEILFGRQTFYHQITRRAAHYPGILFSKGCFLIRDETKMLSCRVRLQFNSLSVSGILV